MCALSTNKHNGWAAVPKVSQLLTVSSAASSLAHPKPRIDFQGSAAGPGVDTTTGVRRQSGGVMCKACWLQRQQSRIREPRAGSGLHAWHWYAAAAVATAEVCRTNRGVRPWPRCRCWACLQGQRGTEGAGAHRARCLLAMELRPWNCGRNDCWPFTHNLLAAFPNLPAQHM